MGLGLEFQASPPFGANRVIMAQQGASCMLEPWMISRCLPNPIEADKLLGL